MAPLFTLLKDVGPSSTKWAVKLRLIRSYQLPVYGNPMRIQSTNCIYHDYEGERIHATIRTDLMRRYNVTFTEGSVFAIKNFVVTNNKMRYKTTNHRYMLIMVHDTKISEIYDAAFPLQLFNFKPFPEICNVDEMKENELFDVIGRVSNVGPRQNCVRNEQETTTWMEVVLEDHQQNRLYYTPWGHYVDQMMDRVRAGGEAPIMVLQFCRGKLYRDRVSISTTYYASKLILDGDLGEISAFKTRFPVESNGQSAVTTMSFPTLTLETDDSVNVAGSVRTIQQLRTLGEVGSFWVFARIMAIETNGQWWYLSCPKCYRKIIKADHKFYCVNCDLFDSTGMPRYKMQVLIQDDTDNASVLLWDQHCTELIGKTALDLLERNLELGDSNFYPEDMYNLLEQEVYLKIQVASEQITNFYGAYSVKKMSK